MERTHLAATLNQSEHGLFALAATLLMEALIGVFVLFLAADIRLVGFDNLAPAADWAA